MYVSLSCDFCYSGRAYVDSTVAAGRTIIVQPPKGWSIVDDVEGATGPPRERKKRLACPNCTEEDE